MMTLNYLSTKFDSELMNKMSTENQTFLISLLSHPFYLSLLPFDGKIAATAPAIMPHATTFKAGETLPLSAISFIRKQEAFQQIYLYDVSLS